MINQSRPYREFKLVRLTALLSAFQALLAALNDERADGSSLALGAVLILMLNALFRREQTDKGTKFAEVFNMAGRHIPDLVTGNLDCVGVQDGVYWLSDVFFSDGCPSLPKAAHIDGHVLPRMYLLPNMADLKGHFRALDIPRARAHQSRASNRRHVLFTKLAANRRGGEAPQKGFSAAPAAPMAGRVRHVPQPL